MHILASILTWMFFVGLSGSLVVAIWAFVGDVHVFLEKDEPSSPPVASSPDTSYGINKSAQRPAGASSIAGAPTATGR